MILNFTFLSMLLITRRGSQTVQKDWGRKRIIILIFRRPYRFSWVRSSWACVVHCRREDGMGFCLPVPRYLRCQKPFVLINRFTWGYSEFDLQFVHKICHGIDVAGVRRISCKRALVIFNNDRCPIFETHAFSSNHLGSRMKVLSDVIRYVLSMDDDDACRFRALYILGFNVPRVRIGLFRFHYAFR